MIDYNDNRFFIPAILLLFSGFCWGYICGTNWTNYQIKKQAIQNKVGYWVVDDTGKVEFKWNTQTDK
ncbi:hypothetical protein EBU91_02980 [bacterium]|nr:hypothetical protein [bacterium]